MPNIILGHTIAMNTQQENAGAFVGKYNFAGWDCNRKVSSAHDGVYGFFNQCAMVYNFNVDSFEFVDGAILDNDVKPIIATNI